MKIKTTFLLSFILVLLWSGCKKDPPCDDPLNPECPNYDKCLTAVRTDAEFIVTNWTRPGDIPLPFRDTIPTPGSERLEFRAANRHMSRYEWKIGHDPRVFTDTSFFLIFSNVSGWINFSLTVYNDNADPACFPGDSGSVTVHKAYYFKPFDGSTHENTVPQYPIFGEYLGHDEGSPLDTFRIIIEWAFDLGPYHFNLPRGCNVRLGRRGYFNTHYFVHQTLYPPPTGPGLEQCYTPWLVFAELKPDNKTIHIDYEFTQNGQRIKRKWVGQKLH